MDKLLLVDEPAPHVRRLTLNRPDEYEDRQQIMATFSNGVPEATGAFLEKRPAEFED